MEFIYKSKGGITIEIEKRCSNCRFWDWYYNDQNEQDECGKIIAEFGNCTMNHGYEGVTGKNTPACEDFETTLCTICGEHLKLKETTIDGEKHIEWVCENHMRKCDTCGVQEVFA